MSACPAAAAAAAVLRARRIGSAAAAAGSRSAAAYRSVIVSAKLATPVVATIPKIKSRIMVVALCARVTDFYGVFM